ncbi:MAG: hypothetical protein JWL77_642 [Chthonomonadaceae bacterium]|nr:hypothetical protein [Chthonomonadaceae bacterium]
MIQPDPLSTIDSPWLTAAEPVDETVTMPQTLAGVFDEAFDLYKRHFPLLAMIVAVGLIPTEILRNIVVAVWLHPLDAHLSGVSNGNPDSIVLLRLGQFFFGEPRSGFAGILAFLVLVLLSAPISIAVSDIYFGRDATVKDCYKRSRPYLMSMMWAYCQTFLVSVGVIFVGILAASVIGGLIVGLFSLVRLPDIGGVIFLILLIAVPYFSFQAVIARTFLFVTPLTVLEGLPASYVPYRNNQLVGKKRFGRSWAATSAIPVLWLGFLAILNYSVQGALDVIHLPSVAQFIAVSALGTAVHFFLAPYWTIFVTLLYYDYRVRREGFDVRVLSLANPEKAEEQGAEG